MFLENYNNEAPVIVSRYYPVRHYSFLEGTVEVLYEDPETSLLEFAKFSKYQISYKESNENTPRMEWEEINHEPTNVILYVPRGGL